MNKEQLALLEKMRKMDIEQGKNLMHYWQEYSSFDAWQFWIVVAIFVLPLIVLFLFIDRKKIFQLGFFGYGVHIFFAMSDAFGVSRGLWLYPYKLIPALPANISLDSSFVPVTYILLYQYTLNKRKNYYLWFFLLCLALAFIVKPLLLGIGLFRFGGEEDFLMLFWGYAGVALISKWITDFFLLLTKTNKMSLKQE